MVSIWALLGLVFLVVIAYFLIFAAPDSNLVFSSVYDSEVESVQKLLEEAGIRTYAKNLESQGIVTRRGGSLGNPSLHVIDQKDYQKALAIVATLNK